MLKAKMKKILALLIAGTMLCSNLPASASSTSDISIYAEEITEFAVSFENTYAKVGVPLTATTAGAENVTYQWYVGETLISENTSNSYTPTENDLEKWIEVRVNNGTETVSTKMYCSKLPVVYIDTENGQAITSKTEYIDATIRIQGNDEYSDSGILYEGATEIRGRGNTTWGCAKKPYKLKLDKKTNVFGMGKSKHWVLLANYMDESLMRNTLAYRLAGEMEMDEMSTVWVDVIMNGKYAGNYQFCENVRVDETRVDVFDWEGFAEDSADTIAEAEGFDKAAKKSLESYMSENMGWITSGEVTYNGAIYEIKNYPAIQIPDINGGYLLELDAYWDEVSKFKTNSGQPIQFKNPEYVNTNSEMFEYVQEYVQAFEDAVQSSDHTTEYNGTEMHYSDLYDLDALVDYWMVTEIFFNEEMNKKSTYMYKDIDGKMIMGPIWDMDWSSGAGGTAAGASNQWATNYYNQGAQSSQWYKYLVKDPYFLMKLQERYWEIRNDQVQNMLDSMEVYYEQIKESGKADSQLWHGSGTFDSDYNGLKIWLNAHINWMDQQMATEDSFDLAFLNKSSYMMLSLTDKEGNALMEDYAEKAPADAFAGKTTDLLLHISENITGTAEIYINSRLSGTMTLDGQNTTYLIEAAALTEDVETKNVIEVKVKNQAGSVTASNYVTVRQSTCDHSFEENWTVNDAQHWKECEKCKLQLGVAAHTFGWVIDKEATEKENGIRHEECSVCGYVREAEEYEYVEFPADPSDDSKDLPTSIMTAISGSEQSGNEDANILDGDPTTIWHTQHGTIHTLAERWCGVTLEEPEMVSGIRCLPRMDGGNGTITEYSVQYRTADSSDWIEAATGVWDHTDLSWKMVTFSPVMAKQVRIVGIHTYYGGTPQDKHMSMAEFRLIGYSLDETPEEADKTVLNELIRKAKELKEEDYTLESWKTADLEEIIAHAEMIAADKDADQETVDAETAKLEAAIEKLEEKTETPIDPAENKVVRLSGTDRYATGFAVADKLKEVLGVEKFDTVVIATGKGYADALSGSYLAAVKNAPILLTNGKAANVAELHAYIKANVKAGATIYVLGGEAAVSKEAATIEGYDTTRLSGTNRYETNLAILAEAGVEGQEDLLVATGKDFADSLSASAATRPILLVKPDTALTDAQKAVAANFKNIYVIGGSGAVSEAIAEELAAYGTVMRLSGSNRYETSVKVAETFFTDPETVLLASGKNFPDGLCGGALAAALKAPLLLTKAGAENTAAEYVVSNDIASGYVLGGEGAVTNDTVVTVFGLKSAEEIK